MDRGAWRAAVHGAVKADTAEQLNTHTQLVLCANHLSPGSGRRVPEGLDSSPGFTFILSV